MTVTVLMGSPNRDGSTALLVNEFRRARRRTGTGWRSSICHGDYHPCSGCVRCGYEGPCVQKDDVEKLRKTLLASDMVAFATPLYYFGMTAQLKTVIDRFCAFNSSLNGRRLKSALLAVAWNSDSWTFDVLESHYRTLVRYLNLR